MKHLLGMMAVGSFVAWSAQNAHARSLDIPTSEWGISFGNSKNFNGLRFNYRDRSVEVINGVNVTLWEAFSNETSTINGISLGVLPSGGELNGLKSAFNYFQGSQTGLSIGVVNYAHSLKGVQIGLINIVQETQGWNRVLPLINARF